MVAGVGGGVVAGGHQVPDRVARGLGPRDDADHPAAVQHADPVGEGEDLVELGRHQQHGRPGVAHLDDATVDELDRPDVEPAGGLGDDEQPGLARQLAGDDDLLLVAPGQRGDRGVDARRAHVVALHQLGRLLVDLAGLADEPAGERLVAVGVEHQVVGHRERLDDTVLVAILGNVPDAHLVDLPGAGVGEVDAVERHLAVDLGPHAGDRLDQLALAVALDPRHPEDLTRAHLEGQVGDGGDPPVVVDGEALDLQGDVLGLGRRLLDRQQDLAADHE